MYLKTLEKIPDCVTMPRLEERQKIFDGIIAELSPYIIGFNRHFLINVIEDMMIKENHIIGCLEEIEAELNKMCDSDVMRLGRLLRGSKVLEPHRQKYMIKK